MEHGELVKLHNDLKDHLLNGGVLSGYTKATNPSLKQEDCVEIEVFDSSIFGVGGPALCIFLPVRFCIDRQEYLKLSGMIRESSWAFAQRERLRDTHSYPGADSKGRILIYVAMVEW